MTKYKFDPAKLDHIIKNTIDAITNSKSEIYEIAEIARKECKSLEEELGLLKNQVNELLYTVEKLEIDLKDSKRKLLLVNKSFEKYTQQELKEAYEKADNLRISLAIKREQEQFFIKRRNDLEVRIKEAYKTVLKAENLISQVGIALGYLCGDLKEISEHLGDMHQKQTLGFRILKAQEEERQRVARDIHDGPAQSMSNVVIKAEICERLIDVDLQKSKEELVNLKFVVRQSLKDVRKIIYNLRPMSLDDLGLIPTLQRYISNFQDETGVESIFRSRGEGQAIKPVVSLTIFRIVQEALNNITKHAKANNISVNIEFIDKEIKLYINDDGVGFKSQDTKQGNRVEAGFGLLSMKERVDLLGGNIQIVSHPGKGTRIFIILPFNQEERVENE